LIDGYYALIDRLSTGCANPSPGLIFSKQQEKLMKLIKNLSAALLLASVLSVNVSAGDQHSPGYVPPPPAPATCPAENADTAEETQATEAQEPALTDELLVNALMTLLSLY
jgi:hypothetical protein